MIELNQDGTNRGNTDPTPEDDIVLPPIEDSPPASHEEEGKELELLAKWFLQHVTLLRQDAASRPQLHYIRTSLAPRLLKYRENV